MSASDVMMAYSRHCRDLTINERVSLEKRGVPAAAIDFDDGEKQFKLRAASVLWEGPYFTIDMTAKAGQRVIAIVCRDECGEVADLAAWAPGDDRTGLWLGSVAMLGEEAVLRPRLEGDKLWVHPTPLDWLVHRRAGIVILNHDKARPILVAGSPVAVRTKKHAQWLETQWQAPRIIVVDDGVAAAVTEAA